MNLSTHQPDLEIVYPDGDGQPMTESDPTRDYLIYGVEALSIYFQDQPDAYVSGNLFIYYKRGVPDAVISPDVFVVFGVEKKKRRSYKVWEEAGNVPSFVLEVTSKRTQENDETEKPRKYRDLGVLEYFQYDPTGDYLRPQLKGSHLIDGVYQPILPNYRHDGTVSLYSEALGLELRLMDGNLRFYDLQADKPLLTYAETEQARQQAEQARQRAEQARQQAEQARRDAVPRLLGLGLSGEQVAEALSLSVAEVEAIRSEGRG